MWGCPLLPAPPSVHYNFATFANENGFDAVFFGPRKTQFARQKFGEERIVNMDSFGRGKNVPVHLATGEKESLKFVACLNIQLMPCDQ